MKKGVEIAFAVTLVILAVVASVFPSETTESITYAVILPSFILTLISFVSDVMISCGGLAEKLSADTRKISDLSAQIAKTELQSYEAGTWKEQYIEGLVPKEIFNQQQKSFDYLKVSFEYLKGQILFLNFKKACNKIIVVGYILLFLSLCFSPIIVKWLSAISLSSITLWSLSILYITLELKEELCEWIFGLLHKRVEKKLNVEIRKDGTIIAKEEKLKKDK